MKDLIIIGAGTAGLTAAIYGLRAGLDLEVIEQSIYGGQIINTASVENYPGMPGVSGAEFAMALFQQAKDLGAQVSFGTITEASLQGTVKTFWMGETIKKAKSIIIATGASPRKLGIPGEEALTGAGVSYCATCDGAFHRGKDVAVVGGGNTAVEDALILSGLCRKVYLIHRRVEFRAAQHTLHLLRGRKNAEIIADTQVQEIQGGRMVERLLLRRNTDGQERQLDVSSVFVAVGVVPDNRLFAGQLSLDEGGYIIAGEDCETNLTGVFVAGDTRTKKVRQIVTAAADGAVAAMAAGEYVSSLTEAVADG